MLHRSIFINVYGPYVPFVGVVLVCSSFLFWHGLGAALCRKIEYTLDEKRFCIGLVPFRSSSRCGQTHIAMIDV